MRSVVLVLALVCLAGTTILADETEDSLTIESEQAQEQLIAADSFLEVAKANKGFTQSQLARLKRLRNNCNAAKKRVADCRKEATQRRRQDCVARRKISKRAKCNVLKRYSAHLWKHYKKCYHARKLHHKLYGHRATQKRLSFCLKRHKRNKILLKACRARVLKNRAKSLISAFKMCRTSQLHAVYSKVYKKIDRSCKKQHAAFTEIFGGDFLAKRKAACLKLFGKSPKYAQERSKCYKKAQGEKSFAYNTWKKCTSKRSKLKKAYSDYDKATQRPAFLHQFRTADAKAQVKCRKLRRARRKARRAARRALRVDCAKQKDKAGILKCLAPFVAAKTAALKASVKCAKDRRTARRAVMVKIHTWREKRRITYQALMPFVRSYAKATNSALTAYMAKQNRIRAARLQAEKANRAKKAALAKLHQVQAQLKALKDQRNKATAKALKEQKKLKRVTAGIKQKLKDVVLSKQREEDKAKKTIEQLKAVLKKHHWSISKKTKSTKHTAEVSFSKERRTACHWVKTCKAGKYTKAQCEALRTSSKVVTACAKYKNAARHSQCVDRHFIRCTKAKKCSLKKVCHKAHLVSFRTVKNCEHTKICAAKQSKTACLAYANKKKKCDKKCTAARFKACRKKHCYTKVKCSNKTCKCTRHTKATCTSQKRKDRRVEICKKVKGKDTQTCLKRLYRACRKRVCHCKK